MSRSQIDKLGTRIRKSTTISDTDRDALHAYINEHSDAEQAVAERLREGVVPHIGRALAERIPRRQDGSELRPAVDLRARPPDPLVPLAPTSRIKTTDTTIEKLRREKTRLSTIDDIAGVRVVLESGGWIEQDAIVAAIEELYPGCRRKDRRENPSTGYRAVHVIVSECEHLVEIQVRTKPQDDWAQFFERLADEVGRQIRYGDPPTDPAVTKIVQTAIRYSGLIGDLEDLHAKCRVIEVGAPYLPAGPLKSIDKFIAGRKLNQVKQRIERMANDVARQVNELREVLG